MKNRISPLAHAGDFISNALRRNADLSGNSSEAGSVTGMNRRDSHSFQLSISRGFTLVELLVTITIIITLAALILAGVRRMKTSADKVVATRNASQLQIANISYSTDHNGRYMPAYGFNEDKQFGGNWFCNEKFLSYLNGEGNPVKTKGGLFTVPLNLLDPVAVRAKKRHYDNYCGSFGYNTEGMDGPGRGWGIPGSQQSFFVHEIVSPERSAAFITSTHWVLHYGGRFLWKGAKAVEGASDDGKIAFRHDGKALVVYYDGHVGELTMADLKNIDTSGSPPGVNDIFWNADGK